MALLLINFVVFAVLAELASIVIVHLKRWPASRPTYHVSKPFWGDINPVFGIWHYPDGVFYHQGACFDVTYHTNSYGARDVERSLHASQPRTVMLGDSFVEGLDSSDRQRLTSLLEQQTGREHLNFGTSGGFSPLQYALLYRSLASRFDHNLVVVGVFPDNDFHEMDAAWLEKNYAGEYRPYYAPDLLVKYLGRFDPQAGDSAWDRTESVLRGYLASYHVGSVPLWHAALLEDARSLLRVQRLQRRRPRKIEEGAARHTSDGQRQKAPIWPSSSSPRRAISSGCTAQARTALVRRWSRGARMKASASRTCCRRWSQQAKSQFRRQPARLLFALRRTLVAARQRGRSGNSGAVALSAEVMPNPACEQRRRNAGLEVIMQAKSPASAEPSVLICFCLPFSAVSLLNGLPVLQQRPLPSSPAL